jgi:hypothetical protein
VHLLGLLARADHQPGRAGEHGLLEERVRVRARARARVRVRVKATVILGLG